MTRHKTAWWSRMFATSPRAFLRRPEGRLLVDILTEWWTESEGLADGTWAAVDHSRRAAANRYSLPTFYARLDAAGFAVLPDVDEHAVDAVFAAFAAWTRTRKARTLVERLAVDIDSNAGIGQDQVGHQVRHHVQHHVSHEVHHQIHAHIHAQVHHAVSHAAHDAGAGGHAGGGGHH